MAVEKMKRPGQKDSEEAHKNEVHVHITPAMLKQFPMYDDGGDVAGPPDTSGLSLQGLDPNQMAKMDPTVQPPSTGQRLANAAAAMGRSVGGTNDAGPQPEAQTHMYPVQGLDAKNMQTPMFDDGGVVKMSPVRPDDDSAAGIRAKQAQIEEYEGATQPVQKETVARGSSPQDKVNPSAKYGDRPGEKRIDVSDMVKPIGGTKMYDDGGPVKNDPNDGHHQLAVLEEGERVLTPEQNMEYEVEHGTPRFEQPNPPVQPMMDTERTADEPTGGAKMDVSNPQAADFEPAMARTVSNKVAPTMERPTIPFAEAGMPQTTPSTVDQNTVQPKMQPGAGAPVVGTPNGEQPKANPLAHEGPVLPSDHDNYQREKAALKQRMLDAAEGKNTNGKFDHIGYGEAKLALADLEKSNPYGSKANHPGILGKIGHGLATAGELASDIVLGPAITAQIPGTRESLMREAGEGQKQITQGLAGQESQAKTELMGAQAQVAGMPKTTDEAVSRAAFKVQHTEPGTPAHYQATKDYDAAVAAAGDEAQAKQDAKTRLQDLQGRVTNQLLTEKDPAKRAQLQDQLNTIDQQLAASKKASDKQMAISNYAKANGLDVSNPADYEKARVAVEREDAAETAEARLPSQQKLARYRTTLQEEAQSLNNINADATTRGLEADKQQMKFDAQYQKDMTLLTLTKNALDQSDANQVAANVAPLLGTLGIMADVGGVKRLNTQELARFAPANGSVFRWFSANADKLAAGQLPDGYQQNLNALVDSAIKAKSDEHATDTQSVNNLIRRGGQEPVTTAKKGGGTKVTARPSTPASPTSGQKSTNFSDWNQTRQQQNQPKK